MELPNSLVREIQAGNVVLFVGAGLSQGAGLPGWKELIHPLARELNAPQSMDLIKVAQHYELTYGRHALISYIIDKTTVDTNPTETHRLLADLPIQTWITTNYDNLIESTFRETGKHFQKVVQDQDLPYLSGDRISLVKMHGDREQPNSIIITEQDYFTYFRNYPLVRVKLANLLTEKSFLFVGYSNSDPDFRQIYNEVAFDLRQHQRASYAFMFDVDPFTIEELKARNVQVINIPLDAGDDPTIRLRDVLETLCRRVKAVGSSSTSHSLGPALHGRYIRTDVLAETGLSTVYKAHDTSTDTPCVVKHVDLKLSPDALDVIALNLKHPRIAEVLSFWREEDTAFVVQRYYEGWTLDELIRANPTGFGEGWVEQWAGELMSSLVYLHSLTPPLIHRDLRPPNILVQKSDRSVILLDWSSALRYTQNTVQPAIGTMEGYTAPEQLRGAAEPRSDLYSLGAVLYCLLAGTPPPNVVARSHGAQLKPEPLNAGLLGSYIEKMLRFDPSERFPSAAAMLGEWKDDQSKTRVVPDLEIFFKGVFPSADNTWLEFLKGTGRS